LRATLLDGASVHLLVSRRIAAVANAILVVLSTVGVYFHPGQPTMTGR
jgi:hypothetical protein